MKNNEPYSNTYSWSPQQNLTHNSSATQYAGSFIDAYRLEQLLDQNEFGMIFSTHTEASTMLYRLHMLRLSETLTPEARMVMLGHFQREARELLQVLSNSATTPLHPSLLPFIDFGQTQELLYLVSPYPPMRTFTELLQESRGLDALTVSLYLDQIASALEYAHQHAILHRNLTTDAIFLRNDGRLLVADLGVMRILELSRHGQAGGVLYGNSRSSAPAPEQLLGQPVSSATDVYALGALLYHLLTGHQVFESQSRDALVQQHLRAPVPSLARWQPFASGRSNVTAALDSLIAAAMAKDPLQRIQHPAELANAYHQIVAPYDQSRQPIMAQLAPLPQAQASTTSPTSSQYKRDAEQARTTRRRALMVIGSGALAVIAFVTGQKFVSPTSRSFTSSTPSTGSSSSTTGSTTTGSASATQTPANAAGSGGGTQASAKSGTMIAKKSAVPVNNAVTFPNPHSNTGQPGILVHLSNGKFVAFDSACTHNPSCAVQYDPQNNVLVCPCHDGTFDPANNAAVLQGPPPAPLAAIPITVNSDGTITMNA
jgi:Serine/threonine protein kinase